MDVYNMYVGDCTSTFRTNMFRDYEKHPYGTFEGNHQQQPPRKSYYTMVQEKLERARQMAKPKKSACPFCKDEKNQPLKAYLRRRSREKKNSKICEEEEEEENVEEETQKCCSSGENHNQEKK